MREVNGRFLVIEQGDLSVFFSLFPSLVNAFLLYSEYKQIFIVKNQVISKHVNFATTSEDKFAFVTSRSLHVWNKLNRCRAFVLKHTINCFFKSMQCF